MNDARGGGRVLVIAGSDSSGGAGIQADIKTIMALGGYATTAIAAVTVQNSLGVFGVHQVPADFIAGQIRAALNDIGADAIKTGMVGSAEAVYAIARTLDEHDAKLPLVVDPVMRATGGAELATRMAIEAIKAELFLRATIVTPNIPESEQLAGFAIQDLDDMKRAADLFLTLGPESVLIKGGHLETETVFDVLLTADGFQIMSGPRIASVHTHGTGCTLASGIACGLAQGLDVADAVRRARAFVRKAIGTAPGLGFGHGPLNHAHSLAPFPMDER